jgi:hypothetical protein
LTVSKPVVTRVDIKPPNPRYGDTVMITCYAIGNPPPTYEFMYKVN